MHQDPMAGGLSLMNGAWHVGKWVGPGPKFFQASIRMNFEGKEYISEPGMWDSGRGQAHL